MFNPKQNILDQQFAESGIELSFGWDDVKTGFADVVTSGAYSRNKANEKQANITNKAAGKLHKFNKKEAKRTNEYNTETLRITKENNEKNLQYQEGILQQQYNQARAVKHYEFRQAKRAFQQSKRTARTQLNYNRLAAKTAFLDQQRYFKEQMLDLKLSNQESISDYRFAAAGINVKRAQAKQEAKFEARRAGIEALKAEGEVAARGQAGQSVAAIQSGIAAEAGANQAEIIQALLSTEQGLDIDLRQLNDRLIMDRAKIKMSKVSLRAADKSARYNIKLERAQADSQARASIALAPEKQPPIPKPFTLPRPEYQDIYKVKAPPRQAKVIAPKENLFAAGVNTAVNYASAAAGIYSGFK